MAMETLSSLNSQRKKEDDLKEWGVKARMISRENTISRRFSSSYITSFREDACKSFRSHLTISSTASSPGYTLKEEIDPTTYSFTNALKALQLRSINTWEYSSPEGYALNSKWNEAERYICNPLSGEVPVECLSSKTLMSSPSFRNITNKLTLSAPLIHHSSRIQPLKLANLHPIQGENDDTKENKLEDKLIMMKEDLGIQITLSDSSRSPISTPSNQDESSIKFSSNLDSSDASSKCESKSETEIESKPKETEIESKPKVEFEFKEVNCGKQSHDKLNGAFPLCMVHIKFTWCKIRSPRHTRITTNSGQTGPIQLLYQQAGAIRGTLCDNHGFEVRKWLRLSIEVASAC